MRSRALPARSPFVKEVSGYAYASGHAEDYRTEGGRALRRTYHPTKRAERNQAWGNRTLARYRLDPTAITTNYQRPAINYLNYYRQCR